MGICIGLIVMSYKKRNLFGEQGNSKPKSDRGFIRTGNLAPVNRPFPQELP
jgi:hypothetical protein